MATRVEIRPPRALRIYTAVFGFVWCGGVLAALIVTVAARTPTAALPAVMLAVGGWFFLHAARVSVAGDPAGLTVRNYWGTRRVLVGDIEGFRIGSASVRWLSGDAVHVLLSVESMLVLDATSRVNPLPGGGERVNRNMQMLRGWLAQANE